MDTDTGSSVDRDGLRHADAALSMLRTEHRMIRDLFERYFRAANADLKRDAGSHLLLLIELHAAAEEGVFYPRVQQLAPGLVTHCMHEHEQVRRAIAMLKPMDESDPQAESLFRQLAEHVLSHIEDEEQQLFPLLEHSGMDLAAVSHDMMALATRLSAMHRRPPVTRLRQ